jgi:hypothetical protein
VAKYDGMDAQMTRQLRELQKEDARLKRLVAEQTINWQVTSSSQ